MANRPSARMVLSAFPTGVGPVDIVYRTRYLDRGWSTPIPGHLWVEVRGSAPSLKQAIGIFVNAARSFRPIIAPRANAAVDPFEIELAYDASPIVSEHPFFQNVLPGESAIPRRLARPINSPATVAIIHTLMEHPERERILRAINQYELALSYWRFGQETLALAHIFMGTEALAKVAERDLSERLGLSKLELAAALDIKLDQPD